ncbi:MAG: glycoside hydrolase family 3 C-terminal domain-containing protein, partial [Clostridiales bacterium]|nr:glycoside hydrolase family 3 C-terminal domain-containing protein [Clostridiales bacterium]
IEISRNAAAEGIVLLKNEGGLLPLKDGRRVAVFGKAQYDYVKGGGGSGDVTVRYVRNIYDGLKIKESEGKISVYDGLIDFYRTEMEKQYAEGKENGLTEEPEIPEKLVAGAKAYTDTAIITICRFSGEGWDRKGEMHDGDFYLSEQEEKMVNTVIGNFKNVIVIINAGAQTDSEWYHSDDRIASVLYAWQGGMEGGLATADVLCGDVNPSGKLVDTFAKRFSDYPSSESFSESDDYVKYYEDIYVGYRYFETVPGAKERVNYPFGFGLSYTDFDISCISARLSGDKIKVSAVVTNTGSVSGKEVVQVYYSAPQGLLGKPVYELPGFKKTDLLAPGESRTVYIDFPVSSMASYDDTGKLSMSSYVLEKGSYKFFVGNSVRNTVKADYEYTVEADTVTEQLSQQAAPVRLEKRMFSDGSFEKMPSYTNNIYKNEYKENTASAPEETAKLIDVYEGKVTLDEFIAQLTDDELVGLTYGQPNTAAANTCGMGNLEKYGIPNVMTADGPAGLRINKEVGVVTTAFPCATMIACTWDPDIMYKIGVTGAKEVKENNIGIWLTPALNIHRNPLCGRNFEYYSEDPLIAGKMAAAKVRGIQSQHIAASAKHLCANNKEVNRLDSDSIVSERALREIYLKGFEICVKESQPWTVMSSYNIVNGTRASENHDIITNILRGEWGFEGMVTSDWWNHAEQYRELKAGNDVKMPIGQHEAVMQALSDGKISRAEIEVCVKRLLEMIMKID